MERASRKAVVNLAESLGLSFSKAKGWFFVFKDLSTAGKARAKIVFKSKVLRRILAFLQELKKGKEAKARAVFIKENLQKRNFALSKGQKVESHFQPSFCF